MPSRTPRLRPTPLRAATAGPPESAPAAGGPVINEFLAENSATTALWIMTNDGELQDWIEILNRGTNPVYLLGWSLTDSASRPRKWSFPSRVLQPGQYLLLYASGKDRRPTDAAAASTPTSNSIRLASTWPLQRGGTARHCQRLGPRVPRSNAKITLMVSIRPASGSISPRPLPKPPTVQAHRGRPPAATLQCWARFTISLSNCS
jgi:hypothetical protein